MYKITKKMIFIFNFILNIYIFGNEVPNEIITKNPIREVTTIESKKLRDRATLSLEITKINPKRVLGILSKRTLTVDFYTTTTNKSFNYDLQNINLKVEAFSTKENLSSSSEIKNKKIEKHFEKIKINNGYRLNIKNVSEDEEIYISVLKGNKVVRAYYVEKRIEELKNSFSFQLESENVLNFGKMIYNPNNPNYTAFNIFKVRGENANSIEFSVEQDSQMFISTNVKNTKIATTPIDVNNIYVKRIDAGNIKDESLFSLEATATLTEFNSPGVYKGEIFVTITLKDGGI